MEDPTVMGDSLEHTHRLSDKPDTVYFIENPPQAASANVKGCSPRLIILCTWTDARPRLISKYVNAYRLQYPACTILVAKTSTKDFFFSSASTWHQKLLPAIRFIHQSVDPAEASEGDGIMAHALSNGGSGHLTYLARAYRHEFGVPLPIQALILDSTPTRADFRSLVAALSIGLPPNVVVYHFSRLIIILLVLVLYVIPRLLGRPNLADQVCDDLNADGHSHTNGKILPEFLEKRAQRTYIFSQTDDLCPGHQILPHVAQAVARGFCVDVEIFENSAHVSHMRTDSSRYWSAVHSTFVESHHIFERN